MTESNWRDAIEKDPFFAGSETPYFVGRAVAALAADPKVILRTGALLKSGNLAEEYGFTDIDGGQPNVERSFAPLLDERWEKVLRSVRAEFEKHGFDPAAILEEDRQNLTLRARLAGDGRSQWLTEVLGPPGVVFSSPKTVARKFYQRFEQLR